MAGSAPTSSSSACSSTPRSAGPSSSSPSRARHRRPARPLWRSQPRPGRRHRRGRDPATLPPVGEEPAALGRSRHRWTWLYGVPLVLLLVAMLLPPIDAWVSGALTLAAVPVVVVVTCLACVGGTAGIRWLVARGAQRRMGLDIDFRMPEEVRRDRATVRLAIWSGVCSNRLGVTGPARRHRGVAGFLEQPAPTGQLPANGPRRARTRPAADQKSWQPAAWLGGGPGERC
jgi:hypothetical protein